MWMSTCLQGKVAVNDESARLVVYIAPALTVYAAPALVVGCTALAPTGSDVAFVLAPVHLARTTFVTEVDLNKDGVPDVLHSVVER